MADSYHVYVLRSEVTGRLYIGSAAGVCDRLKRHNRGESKATQHGVPWLLVHEEPFATRSEAVRREMHYKAGKGREELRSRLNSTLDQTGRRDDRSSAAADRPDFLNAYSKRR